MACECARRFDVVVGRGDEYARAKRLLNQGRHPTFIGRDLIRRNAANGGLLLFVYERVDVALAILNPRFNILLVLNVLPAHRGHGLGGALLAFCRPTWVRAIESSETWFTARGYVALGDLKQGRRHRTRVLVDARVMHLAGRVSRVLGARLEEREMPDAGAEGNGTRPSQDEAVRPLEPLGDRGRDAVDQFDAPDDPAARERGTRNAEQAKQPVPLVV